MNVRFVPVSDKDALKISGVPYSQRYLYKLRHMGTYPGLVVKVGRRLLVDLKELEKLAEQDKVEQKRKFVGVGDKDGS